MLREVGFELEESDDLPGAERTAPGEGLHNRDAERVAALCSAARAWTGLHMAPR